MHDWSCLFIDFKVLVHSYLIDPWLGSHHFRPTIFIEIIQRVGCMEKDEAGALIQKGGCGGFGKGNFSELFKSIEEYEKTLDGTLKA